MKMRMEDVWGIYYRPDEEEEDAVQVQEIRPERQGSGINRHRSVD